MSIRENWHNPAKESRLKMEDAARSGTAAIKGDDATEQKTIQGYRLRGKLYDKIKIPLKTIDIIIGVIVALLVAALVVGITTK